MAAVVFNVKSKKNTHVCRKLDERLNLKMYSERVGPRDTAPL